MRGGQLLHHFWGLSWEIKPTWNLLSLMDLDNNARCSLLHYFSTVFFLQHRIVGQSWMLAKDHTVWHHARSTSSYGQGRSSGSSVLQISKMLWKSRLECQRQFSHLDRSKKCCAVEEHLVHEHLHANAAVTSSCSMNDIYCCNSFTAALPVFSLPIMTVRTSVIKEIQWFFFFLSQFRMNALECLVQTQSGVRGFPVSWCVWALTHWSQKVLISLTNWVKVARDSLPSTSPVIEIRAHLWIWEGTYGIWEEGNGRKEERVRNQRPVPTALSPLSSPAVGTPTGQLMWWVNLAICLLSHWHTQKHIHT